MLIDQLELRILQLDIEPESARALLALPLVAALSVDQTIHAREHDEVETFCRQRLGFEEPELGKLREWCADVPGYGYVEEGTQLLEALHLARDERFVGNRALERVLTFAEKMLRRRELQSVTPVVLGQQLLECFSQRFGIDLDVPRRAPAPEVLDENGVLQRESGIRKKPSNPALPRLAAESPLAVTFPHERGGK